MAGEGLGEHSPPPQNTRTVQVQRPSSKTNSARSEPQWPNWPDMPGQSSALARAFAASLDALAPGAGGTRRPLDYLEIGSARGHSIALVGSLLRARGQLGRLVSVDPYAVVNGWNVDFSVHNYVSTITSSLE